MKKYASRSCLMTCYPVRFERRGLDVRFAVTDWMNIAFRMLVLNEKGGNLFFQPQNIRIFLYRSFVSWLFRRLSKKVELTLIPFLMRRNKSWTDLLPPPTLYDRSFSWRVCSLWGVSVPQYIKTFQVEIKNREFSRVTIESPKRLWNEVSENQEIIPQERLKREVFMEEMFLRRIYMLNLNKSIVYKARINSWLQNDDTGN